MPVPVEFLRDLIHFLYSIALKKKKKKFIFHSVFSHFWLAQIPKFIFHNQLELTKSGRSEQNTIMDIAQVVSFPGKYPSDQPRIQASELKRPED